MAVALVLLASGCTPGTAEEREAVARYAAALPSALSGSTLASVTVAATPQEAERVRLYVMQLVGEHRTVRARLDELEYLSAETGSSDETATVRTRETWTTGVVASGTAAPQTSTSEVTYHLVRTGGRWLVDSVEEEQGR